MSFDFDALFNSTDLLTQEEKAKKPVNGEKIEKGLTVDYEGLTDNEKLAYDAIAGIDGVDKLQFENPATSQPSGKYLLIRQNTNEILGSDFRGPLYQPTTKDQIFDGVQAAIGAFDCSVAVDIKWGQGGINATVAPTDPKWAETLGGHNLIPKLCSHVSYSGSRDRWGLGLWYALCSNLMIFGTMAEFSTKIRHQSSHEKTYKILADDLRQIANGTGDLKSRIEAKQAENVNAMDVFESIFGPVGDFSPQAKTTIGEIMARYHREAVSLGSDTVTNAQPMAPKFALYNAIQGHYQHGGPKTNSDQMRGFKAANAPQVVKAEKLLMAV